MKYTILLSLSLTLLLFAGCGENVGLSGKVFFSDDKSPVPLGTVGLVAESGTHIARGDIKPDGTFVIGSLKVDDGLPPGKYRVSVSAMQQISADEETGGGIYESLIALKHGNPDTSGITIDITSTTRNFDIEVERYVPPQTGRR